MLEPLVFIKIVVIANTDGINVEIGIFLFYDIENITFMRKKEIDVRQC